MAEARLEQPPARVIKKNTIAKGALDGNEFSTYTFVHIRRVAASPAGLIVNRVMRVLSAFRKGEKR
jgi:hypothetical protein